MTHVVVTGVSARRCRACLALVAACAFGACQHYQADLPGTLDLRSDGADAPQETRPLPPEATRGGLEAWMKGAGATTVEGAGASAVAAEDRAVWALRLFALGDGVTDEVAGALGTGGALRTLALQEQISLFDAALFACTLPVPCIDIGTVTMLPTYTVRLTGTRVRPEPRPRDQLAPTAAPDAAAPPPPPPEPTPTLDRASGAGGSTP
ncbi:MAG: hypothetical protein IT383_13590 [Deltaproteobacteria bacterium]|nr:hypothetical protein [Deltaproteobacteria bacterium]